MSCTSGGSDAFGREIGICSSGGEDLNAWLVANCWAFAHRLFFNDYVGEEALARSNRRGIHHGEFVEPGDWGSGERIEGEDTFAVIASIALDAGALTDGMLRGAVSGVYGHWLDNSMFAMVDDTVAVSFEDFPDTNPIGLGGGEWTGAMVGMDTGTQQRIDGDAQLETDDFASPDVDVTLTDIADASGRAKRECPVS